MAASFSQGVIRAEKLAIFTSSKEVDEFQIREFFLERWDFLSQGLDNGTMLFLAGVHGTEDGKVGENSDSLETMMRQVTQIFKLQDFTPIYILPITKVTQDYFHTQYHSSHCNIVTGINHGLSQIPFLHWILLGGSLGVNGHQFY